MDEKSETESKTKSISTIEDYVHWLETEKPAKNDLIFFRGDRKKSDLLPGIARGGMATKNPEEREKDMLNEIKRWKCHSGFFSQNFTTESDLELLVYAQHFWMKTRLLDWTPNPLAALFFALDSFRNDLEGFRSDLVENPKNYPEESEEFKTLLNNSKKIYKNGVKSNPPVVYMLKPFKHRTRYCHNQGDIEKREDWVKMRETIVYIPNYNNDRIMAQDGVFTFHAFSDFGFVPLNKMDPTSLPGELKLATIDKEKVQELLLHLNILGVNQHTIYPDFQNLCKHVNWKWDNDNDCF